MFDKVQIVGSYPYVNRSRTGLFSLDLALSDRGDLGAPLRGIYEVYGYRESGKSTLCYYLAGKLSKQKELSICDMELSDLKYLQKAVAMSGFEGTVRVMDLVDDKGKPRTHEQMMAQMVDNLETSSGSCILDSVGAIQPIPEAAGDFGEAFVGKRAKLVAQVARALSGALRLKEEEAVALVINHTHQIIGGHGHNTAGGETLKYLATVRMMIWTAEVIKGSDDERVLGYRAAGQVEKLRFGGRGGTLREFGYYIVPGIGVHPGATAMYDCLDLGLAEQPKGSANVKMEGKSLGKVKKDFLEYALTGRDRKFEPFYEALNNYEQTLKYEEPDEDTDTRKTRKEKQPVDGSAETDDSDNE